MLVQLKISIECTNFLMSTNLRRKRFVPSDVSELDV